MRQNQRRKRRNIILFLFTLVICMFGSFYYFSNDINIKGVGSSDGNFKVLVTDVSLKETSGILSDRSKTPSISENRIEFSPFLNNANERLTYTITVENQGSLEAKYRFVTILDDKNPEVKFELGDESEWNILKSGAKHEFDIDIYYDSEYAGKSTGDFSNLILNLESVQNVSDIQEDDIIQQPVFTENGSSIKITYPEGCGTKYKCTYQKDSNSEVTVGEKSVEVKFPSSGIVTAKVSNKYNSVSNSHNVTVSPLMKVWHSNSSDDFHSEQYKSKISYVEFIDNINIPKNAISWDISYDKNGSVIAYIVDNNQGYNLYIGGVGGVIAKDLSYLFYDFSNLQNINLSKLNTANTIAMRSTFEKCPNLSSLDLKSFDTSNVVVMNNMFKNSSNLKKIYVSNSFITKQVISSKNMFLGCNSLVGQTGTTYNQENSDKVYAVVGPNGYFSTI